MNASGSTFPQIVLRSTDLDFPDDLPTGHGRYTEFEPIARGAKAELRSCWDPVMCRRVAMKTLRSEFARDATDRRRFLREARITAQLQHPATVPVYEIGRYDGDCLYFTMKCIAGEDLFKVLQRLSWKDRVTEKTFPRERLVDIAIQAAQACAYAHVHGVVHRDLKPENIWVGLFGEVTVLDWGVAKVWGATVADVDHDDTAMSDSDLNQELTTLTRIGQRPGTPLYMSPEQVLGKSSLDERSDIFSMGVVLYELLAFREPFRGRTVRQTFENILHDDPPPMREAVPERNVPEALETIVSRSLDKDPAARFQSMVELIDALAGVRRDLLADN
jgi:serine/threonine protein kinase